MPLAEDEERAEYERRMDQMALNIEKMRADLALDQEKFQADLDYRSKMLRWEVWKYSLQLVAGFGAAAGGGAALLALILHLTGRL
jgi:hypothetical protein